MTAVGLALLSALLFGGMSVALRIALDRERDARLGTLATVATALVVALAWAIAEAPSRGIHATAAWPFALAGLLQPGIGQLFATLAIRETGSVTPDSADASFYGKAHRVYQSLYPALKPVCAAIAGM